MRLFELDRVRWPGGHPRSVSLAGDALRVSPHLHMTSADVDRLIDTLASTL